MPRTYARLSDRHPFEVYLLALTLISSVPASFGLAPAPATIRVQLDPIAARLWAIALMVGAATALVGLAWRRPKRGLSVTGLGLEQVGLTFVGAGTIFYGAVAIAVSSDGGASAQRLLETHWHLALASPGLLAIGAVLSFLSSAGAVLIPIGTVLAFGTASFRQAWKIHRILKVLQEER